LPALQGPYYLALRPDEAKVAIFRSGEKQARVELANIEGIDRKPAAGEALALDRRILLIPDALLLITIPASNDRLILRRVGLDKQ
jgi:hypothetical protein